MKAIILSAGQGSRLLPHTQALPKCLLPVSGDITLLGWQLTQLETAGVSEAVVVSGFYAEKVEAELAAHSLPTRSVFNPFYKVADNLGSVWMAREEMGENFILINGDTLFTAEVVESLMESAENDSVTVTISRKDIFDDDDMKVVESRGRLLEIGKRLQRADVNAESIGMIAFRGRGAEMFRDTVEAQMRDQASLKNYYLSIIDELAKREVISVAEAAQNAWCEVDFPVDYERAKKMVATWHGLQKAASA
ncbi:MAG: phosphocholine cytidylyltransferase family protein [Alphaproteobacteria bacterium]